MRPFAFIPLRAGSVAIGLVNRLGARDVFLVHRLGRTIARTRRLLGDCLFLGAHGSITFLYRNRRIRTVVFDDHGRIAPFFDYCLGIGAKRADCARSQRDCKDIELHGRLLLITLAYQLLPAPDVPKVPIAKDTKRDRSLHLDDSQWPQGFYRAGRTRPALHRSSDRYFQRRAVCAELPEDRSEQSHPGNRRPRHEYRPDGVRRDPDLSRRQNRQTVAEIRRKPLSRDRVADVADGWSGTHAWAGAPL